MIGRGLKLGALVETCSTGGGGGAIQRVHLPPDLGAGEQARKRESVEARETEPQQECNTQPSATASWMVVNAAYPIEF